MRRKIGIAGVQMFVWAGEIQKNLSIMKDSLKYITALYKYVDMIFFSELSLYGVPFADWRKAAEPIPGPLSGQLCSIAAKTKKWLIPGTLYERDGDAVYNTAIVISPQGDIVAKYRKMFPWQPHEKTTPGQEFCVFDVPDVGRFGLCICYDMWIPEMCRTLAWMGAEAIIHPTMTTTADRAQELILARANAIFNQFYFLDVNGVGFGGVGQSLFVDPNGRVLQSAQSSESLIMAEEIDLETVRLVRQNGTAGVSPILRQFKAFKGSFPPYEQGLAKGEGFKNLKEL